MDVICFKNPNSPTKLEQAEIVNGLTSKMWVERYQKEGEFTFTAPASPEIKASLPIGSFVSHLNTEEIMLIENHEINEDKDVNPEIIITGRSFETYLENRIVGSNGIFPSTGPFFDFYLASDYTWNQIIWLIQYHIRYVSDSGNKLPFISILSSVTPTSTSELTDRTVEKGTLYQKVLDLLSIENLGIKTIRPGAWSPLGAASPNIALVIHKGTDRSQQIVFSYDTGDIENADYLWSNKKFKNAALVSGKFVEVTVVPTAVGYDRRMMYIDASDIDQDYTAVPDGSDLTDVIVAMRRRGMDVLAAQVNLAIAKAQISKESLKAIYRHDFDLGDLITVHGNYNEVSKMIVSEYVEVEDETGESGYPTLITNWSNS